MKLIRLFGNSTCGSKDVVRIVCQRYAAAAGKAKKSGKGSGANDAPKGSSLSKETKSSSVVGANTLKDGFDPKILPDSDYPDSLCICLISDQRLVNLEGSTLRHFVWKSFCEARHPSQNQGQQLY